MLQVGCITRPNLLSQPGLRHRLRLPLPMRVREATSTTPKERTSFWPGTPCQIDLRCVSFFLHPQKATCTLNICKMNIISFPCET